MVVVVAVPVVGGGVLVLMAGREYKQRPEYKQIWPIYIGILTKSSQNPKKTGSGNLLKICFYSFLFITLGAAWGSKGTLG